MSLTPKHYQELTPSVISLEIAALNFQSLEETEPTERLTSFFPLNWPTLKSKQLSLGNGGGQ